MNRRDLIKASLGALGLPLVPFSFKKSVACVIIGDHHDKKDGSINRNYHVYWTHHEGWEEKVRKCRESYWYLKNIKTEYVRDMKSFPLWVQHSVDLKCYPPTVPLTDIAEFHCFEMIKFAE